MKRNEIRAKLAKEKELLEQTDKAIFHNEQNRLEGPHVAETIRLLFKNREHILSEIKDLEDLLGVREHTQKFGKDYLEK